MSESIRELIEKLFKGSSDDFYVEEPSDTIDYLATFGDGSFKKLSPMLLERFSIAGHVDLADGVFDWLSLEDISNISSFQERFEDKLDFFEGSPLEEYQPSDISIFAVNSLNNEIFLLWGQDAEPQILEFYDANEYLYDNFRQYLEKCLESYS